jgi:peptidoglycan/LPS O-acetylase OafA/YrhL
MRFGSMVFWTLMYGVLWNGFGWLGNNIILGAEWDAVGAVATPDFSPPYAGIAREAITLVPDLLYALMFVWLFSRMRTQSVFAALSLAVILSIAVFVTYLAMITSGFLPWELAVKASLLAFVIFLATAPILPLSRRKNAA